MAFKDLRQFLALLEERRQLRRIQTPVSCDLEITEITDRVSKSQEGNLALLFEQVEGYQIPVLVNTFGSQQRIAWALGVENLEELGQRMGRLLERESPGSLLDKLGRLWQISELVRFAPKRVRRAPCQEVVQTENPSLASLPILRCWPEDGGRFITLPLVFTKSPTTGIGNVGMYRLQLYDEQTLGMHWHLHKDGAQHYREAEALGQRLEAAIVLGADPALTYAATAPLPPGIGEVVFAGWLRRQGIEIVSAKTVDLEVPARAEMVLEGYLEPQERRLEGPFGDHTGYYSPTEIYPVFHLTALTHRRNPIYQATIVGRPPMEDAYLGKATERLFLPLIRMVLPEVVDIEMPPEGVFHNLLIVSIRKSFPGQPRKVMYGLWGLMGLMLTKTIIVVDSGVNVHNLSEVLWRVSANLDPRRDLVLVDGPLDALDHASPQPYFGSKLGIDATAKDAADGHPRPWPNEVVMSAEVKRLVEEKWGQLDL